MKFVPASAYGFERQAVRRGAPLYEDLHLNQASLSDSLDSLFPSLPI